MIWLSRMAHFAILVIWLHRDSCIKVPDTPGGVKDCAKSAPCLASMRLDMALRLHKTARLPIGAPQVRWSGSKQRAGREPAQPHKNRVAGSEMEQLSPEQTSTDVGLEIPITTCRKATGDISTPSRSASQCRTLSYFCRPSIGTAGASARDAADGPHVLFPDATDSVTGFRCDVQQQAPGFRLCGDSAPIGCLRRDGAAGACAGGPLRGGPAERLGAGARAPDPAGGSRRLHRRRPAAGHPPRCFPQNRCVNVGEGQGPMHKDPHCPVFVRLSLSRKDCEVVERDLCV